MFKGNGRFSNIKFDLDTRTHVKSMSLIVGGKPYFKDKEISIDCLFKIDHSNNIYR